jgi:hypothetical protein
VSLDERTVDTGAGRDISAIAAQIGFVDDDATPDLAIASTRSTSDDLSTPLQLTLLRGSRHGNLESPSGPFPVSVGTKFVLVDINADGREDIANGWFVGFTDARGEGIEPVVTVGSPLPGMWVWADVDQDGTVDYINASPHYQTLSVGFGLGDGRFAEPATSPYQTGDLSFVTVADVDGDRLGDLIGLTHKTVMSSDVATTGAAVQVLSGNGQGAFEPRAPSLPMPEGVRALSTGDFDCDGHADIVVGTADNSLLIYHLLADATWSAAQEVSVVGSASYSQNADMTVAVGDVNGDGAHDLVAATYGYADGGPSDSTLSVSFGDGTGLFVATEYLEATGLLPSVVTLGDLNADSADDVVALDPVSVTGSITVWMTHL